LNFLTDSRRRWLIRILMVLVLGFVAVQVFDDLRQDARCRERGLDGYRLGRCFTYER